MGGLLLKDISGSSATEVVELCAQRILELMGELQQSPLSNPVRQVALELSRLIEAGEISLEKIEKIITELNMRACRHRIDKMRAYVGELDEQANLDSFAATVRLIFTVDGQPVPFEDFRREWERQWLGAVFTAHPTFGLSRRLYYLMAGLISKQDKQGRLLDQQQQQAIESELQHTPHLPDESIHLFDEQAQCEDALVHARDALQRMGMVVLQLAQEFYPKEWIKLRPQFAAPSTWVGYDLDGRTDIQWQHSFRVRLNQKELQLQHYLNEVRSLLEEAQGPPREPLETLHDLLEKALQLTSRQHECFLHDLSDVEHFSMMANLLSDEHPGRLTNSKPLLELLQQAIDCCQVVALQEKMVLLSSQILSCGLGTARVHVRLNSVQVHNAVHREVSLMGEPDDPGVRSLMLERLGKLLDEVQPVQVNFASLAAERTTARRLFIMLSQMLKHVDDTVPIRFLIAESETAFTVLAALYLARMFDVDHMVDISPLLETPTALQRGATFMESLMKDPHYLAYVQKRGRVCIQTGFSDAGRFIGQLGASMAIERLHMKLARFFMESGKKNFELVMFNTHGESMGRGAHPRSLDDRIDYLFTPTSRALLFQAGVPTKHEVSFQGGDGYLFFQRPGLALATLTRLMENTLLRYRLSPEANNDRFYDQPASIFSLFLRLTSFHISMVDDPHYAALLSMFGTNLLYKSGSRDVRRQHEHLSQRDSTHPRQMRAIPHNAVLQQLGYLANTVSGVGSAFLHDEQHLINIYRGSERLRSIIALMLHARKVSSINATKAYASVFDPEYWCERASQEPDRLLAENMRQLTERLTLRSERYPTKVIINHLRQDSLHLDKLLAELEPKEAKMGEQQVEIMLLHSIRIALIEHLFLLAVRVPRFAPEANASPDEVMNRIFTLNIRYALEMLQNLFPNYPEQEHSWQLHEKATYLDESAEGYKDYHQDIFQPMLLIESLLKRIGVAISHHMGAYG